MTVANKSVNRVPGLPPELQIAQEAIALPEVQEMLQKLARRDKRKQPGTFEMLNDPSLLGYEA